MQSNVEMAHPLPKVLALAPDPGSAKSGRDLANARKWASLGADAEALWGECQGSAKDPYQTRVDLREPAFRCSCPSRKFPCKHSLGLFLLFVEQPKAFRADARPAWLQEWIDSRAARAEKKEKKAAAEPDDPAAVERRAADQARRAAKREDNILAGIEELDRWLRDAVREGLAALASRPYSFWDGPAARLVDAQAPGLARLLRAAAEVRGEAEERPARLLERLSLLHLLISAYRRLGDLPADVQAELRGLVGWTVRQEELVGSMGTRDRWSVLGQRTYEEDRLRVQRTWLRGRKSARTALLLHYAAPGVPLDVTLVPGTAIDAELVWFPGALPLRALVKSQDGCAAPIDGLEGHADLPTALGEYASALARSPWIESYPTPLSDVTPELVDGRWRLRDRQGAWAPLSTDRGEGWRLRALSGGRPISVFGEWDGTRLLALGAWAEGRFVAC